MSSNIHCASVPVKITRQNTSSCFFILDSAVYNCCKIIMKVSKCLLSISILNHTPVITSCKQHWSAGCPLSSTVQRDAILAADGELLGGGLNGGRNTMGDYFSDSGKW